MIVEGRPATGLVIALVVSLAVNLFGGGVWLGRELRPLSPSPPALAGQGMPALLAGIPPEARRLVRQQISANRPEVRERLRDLREARGAAFAVAREPEADRVALEAALARLRQRTEAAQALVHRFLIEALLAVPGDERARWRGEPDEEGRP